MSNQSGDRAQEPQDSSVSSSKPTRKAPATSTSTTERPLFVPNSTYDVPTASAPRGASTAARGTAPKITFKPKVVPRRKREGGPESLLSIGAGSSNSHEEGLSEAHLRRAERGGRGAGRGRGRGARPEAPLMASGPFAQGPAISSVTNARGRAAGIAGPTSGGSGGSARTMDVNRVSTSAPACSGTKKSASGGKKSADTEEELNFDDAGQPMQNLLRMRDETADFWAPVTTDRVERRLREAKIAATDSETKGVKVKVEAEELGFIDVKTEQSESTITSRMPSPEVSSQQGDAIVPNAQPAEESDDEDIAMPTAPQSIATATTSSGTNAGVTKQKPDKGKKKESLHTMTAEEAEEQERFAIDLESLRTNLTRGRLDDDAGLIFIQMPDILPYWPADPNDVKNEPFVKGEDTKQEIVVEDDQRDDNDKSNGIKKEDPIDITRAQGSSTTESAGVGDSKAAPALGNAGEEVKPAAGTKSRKKIARPSQFPPPEGNIGQLHIHRSGRITAEWGDIVMDVGTGSDCGFLQEVVAIDSKTDHAVWSLGTVNGRMMMAPNLDELLGRA